MRRIEVIVRFVAADGSLRERTETIETQEWGGVAGENRVANVLHAEMKAMIVADGRRRHQESAKKWYSKTSQPLDILHFFNQQNADTMWLELANLVMGTEYDLTMARAYRAIEPVAPVPDDDQELLEKLYFAHDKKMTHLNEAMRNVVRVQDLVNRLLHESLSGGLADTKRPDWERSELLRTKVLAALKQKCVDGEITKDQHDRIVKAIGLPKLAKGNEVVVDYRRRLMHRNQPSVDHEMFFTELFRNEAMKSIHPITGNEVWVRSFSLHPPLRYRFEELQDALQNELDAVVEMLNQLHALNL